MHKIIFYSIGFVIKRMENILSRVTCLPLRSHDTKEWDQSSHTSLRGEESYLLSNIGVIRTRDRKKMTVLHPPCSSCVTRCKQLPLSECSRANTADMALVVRFQVDWLSPVQFSSVAQLCPTLCNAMNCNTPGLPVHHQLPESTQTCPLSW